MSETYTNITPEQARKLSQEHTNWQEVCQRHIDTVVPEACKLGKRKAVINLTEFIDAATKEDLDTSFEVMQKLKSLGFKVDSTNEFGFDLKWRYNISISWKSPTMTAKKKQSAGKK